MSENNSDNAGTPGTPSPSTSQSGAAGSPSSPAPSSTPSAPTPTPTPAREAKEAASTDSPESASNVTPENAAAAQRRDAEQARASAAQASAQQEAAARVQSVVSNAERAAATAASANPPAASAASGATSGAADAAAKAPAGGEPDGTLGASAKKDGAPPPGFGSAPDFSASNPPPASAYPPGPPAYLKHNDSAWSVFGRIIAAHARQIFDRAGRRITQRTLRIGVSARIFHPEPGARGLRGKTLQYLEESIAHWVMSRDVLVFMIPTVGHQGMLHPSNIRLRDYAKHLDGLLLQGGADVSPQSYAEVATRPEWPGDRVRDMYELELLHEFVESGKPVLGVCRGCQLINVAFGGTLYQDIATDVPTAGVHVNEHYDQHRHSIHFPEGSTLVNMFPGRREAIVNSIHHQAVNQLGRDLNIEAVSGTDGIIEAVRYRRAPFVMGVQWHPEFHRAGGPELLDCTPLLDTFLRVARETRF
ncbi:Gamma-glutamyl-gamma-aminobutyrate hydrolase PuuD (putrescine degradation), contains GATase1-like domain [Paraburkholderia steynii]|uniref:Gamma-glutamyl-gamma-aminobutyrate hydrolase PuuD (Putrescine degradation), contains GATase1-like domain n=1 Tax=Paraburkholderia steynii TaxID=1245441 RepID=A0A7Z7B3G4_9BURK|nr:type 1 glutamine amidotransferase [Paraburkholderia steynii]SDH02273.1 Gamma-glutamyl-gamma-aminobutyrate hydrolase PuuD (putrescine degradation), contains GATase1-like domain [Paraburkholderia steynii]